MSGWRLLSRGRPIMCDSGNIKIRDTEAYKKVERDRDKWMNLALELGIMIKPHDPGAFNLAYKKIEGEYK
jgi:hypothetical protein